MSLNFWDFSNTVSLSAFNEAELLDHV